MRRSAGLAIVLLAVGFFCAGCDKEGTVLSPVEELERQGDQYYFGQSTEEAAETYLKHTQPPYLRYFYATKLTARVEDLDLPHARADRHPPSIPAEAQAVDLGSVAHVNRHPPIRLRFADLPEPDRAVASAGNS